MSAALYVYALVAAPPSVDLGSGMHGQPLRAVTCGRLAAIVEATTAEPSLTATALREHDAIVRRVAQVAEAILPSRFGSRVESEADLAHRLEPDEDALLAALAEVAGREQMTLRLYEETPRATAPPPPDDAGLGPGRRYLNERRRALVIPRGAALDAVLAGVAPFVRAERIESHGAAPLVASVHHLVDRGSGAAYETAAQAAAAAQPDAVVRVSGPWPPYAFVAGVGARA